MPALRKTLRQKMPTAQFNAVKSEALAFLDRRLATVQSMTSVTSSDVNLNPFLMLLMAPAYLISSPLEASEYAQMAKLPHGDATAFGRFAEERIFPIFGVTSPVEKLTEKTLFSPVDRELTVDGTRYLMSLKSGPWTMNQSHANEMISTFPTIRGHTGAELVIGIVYGTHDRLNNKPTLVRKHTGSYVHVLVGKELWEFITGVQDAHFRVFDAIQEAQSEFAQEHGGKSFAEHILEARLKLAESFRTELGVVESGDAMWQQIFRGFF